MENSELPMVNSGDIMPPLSPCVDTDFDQVSVEIPKSKPSRAITKINKLTHKNGYDSDGELDPFLDTVEGGKEWDEVDGDGELPAGMCAGSNSGAVSSATISKGAKRAAARKFSKKEPIHKKKESSSDNVSRDYGEGGATGGGTAPAGKEQISEDE